MRKVSFIRTHEVQLDYNNKLILLKTFTHLLVLGLPPLTIWFGKTIANLKGWQWTAFPLIIYINVSYIIGTATIAHVMLMDVYRWEESNALMVHMLIVTIGAAFFMIGILLRAMKPI